VLALLLIAATFPWGTGRQTNRRYLQVVLMTTAVGAAEEIYQAFVPQRATSLLDLSADAFGALWAVVAAVLLSWSRSLWALKFVGRRPRP
jgi:VanZ family protein